MLIAAGTVCGQGRKKEKNEKGIKKNTTRSVHFKAQRKKGEHSIGGEEETCNVVTSPFC